MTGAEYTTNPLRWVLIEADPRIRERLERALNPWVGGIGVGLFEQFDAGAVDALSPQILFAPADPELWNQVDAQPGPIRWRIALGRTDSDARIMAERGIDGYLHWPFASEKLLALTARMDGQARRPDRLWLKDGERWCLVDARDVQFCEVKDRQLWVHTRYGPMQFSGSLASLEQRFPQWLRIHRRLLVAPQWVTDLGEQGIKVEGCASRLPVSRRQRARVYKAVLAQSFNSDMV